MPRVSRTTLTLISPGYCSSCSMREAMSRDFGWERSAAKYLQVYRRVLAWTQAAR